MGGAGADEEAAVAVEFAFVVPILMMILLGTVHFGLAVHNTQMAEAAAREGARVASVGADAPEVRARVLASAPGFRADELTSPLGAITVETRETPDAPWAVTETGCSERGHDVRVTVRASGPRLDYDIILVGSVDAEYQASAVFRCEST